MKCFFALLILIIILGLSGCQENIPTDPIVNFPKPISQIIQDKIPICFELCDPLSGVCRVNGCVEYTHQIITAPLNVAGLYTVLLNLQMNSELCSMCMMMHPEWLMRGYGEETVNVSEEGIALVTKLYEITNRFDVVLEVIYLVTTDGVGIAEMKIVPMQPYSL
ncbi:MAG: hypothetical protein HXY48_06405 [Ignavibacteriaceae bacterium]|nr:hypothetical protein [Ignavibacteriaceae bacterium]